MQDKLPKLSDEESRHIQFIASVVEALNSRARPPDDKEKSKPAWQRFLETAGGAALVTVLLGGVLGQCVTSKINEGIKERENHQADAKAYNDRVSDAAKSYLEQEQQVVKRTYELVGKCISDSEDIMGLTVEEFDPSLYEGKDRKDIQKLRDDVREEYNASDKQWRSEGVSLGLLMSYYHNGNMNVMTSWREVKDSLDAYKDCAEGQLRRHEQEEIFFKEEEVKSACSAERQKVRESLDNLTVILESARLDALKKWETPPQ
jgi:hypothetical protein